MHNLLEKALGSTNALMKHVLRFKAFYVLPDAVYLKAMYRLMMGKKLQLTNPISFNEKLQWLKLHYRNPLLTVLSDKYEVRKYVAKKVGEEYLVPLIGIWDKFEDIDIDSLPDQFVLKCTHNSGGVIICQDKSKLDIQAAAQKIKKWLKKNYYYLHREWSYKNIKPRIIGENFIPTSNGKVPIDYKIHCFNGNPDNVMVCTDRGNGDTKFYYYNRDWKLLKYNSRGINPAKDFSLPRPERLDEMLEMARVLSEGFPYLRVDLYFEDNKIYFGELTLYPVAGFDASMLEETDLLFGSKLDLHAENKPGK